MATFTPPANTSEVPKVDASARGLPRRMFQRGGGNPRGRNFYIVDGTTFTEEDPVATYNSNGSLNQEGSARVTRFFQSTTGPFTVSTAEAALITTAGFGAYLT